MRASALAYVFPLLMLVLGVFIGWLVSDSLHMIKDLAMALLALALRCLHLYC